MTSEIQSKRKSQTLVSDPCFKCSKNVFTLEKIVVDDHPMHETCFVCETCNSPLNVGNYQSLGNRYYCVKDFYAAKRGATSKTAPTTGDSTNTSRTQKSLCISCSKRVFNVEGITLDEGQMIHRACFTCAECGEGLSPSNFQPTEGGKFLCMRHSKRNTPGIDLNGLKRRSDLLAGTLDTDPLIDFEQEQQKLLSLNNPSSDPSDLPSKVPSEENSSKLDHEPIDSSEEKSKSPEKNSNTCEKDDETLIPTNVVRTDSNQSTSTEQAPKSPRERPHRPKHPEEGSEIISDSYEISDSGGFQSESNEQGVQQAISRKLSEKTEDPSGKSNDEVSDSKSDHAPKIHRQASTIDEEAEMQEEKTIQKSSSKTHRHRSTSGSKKDSSVSKSSRDEKKKRKKRKTGSDTSEGNSKISSAKGNPSEGTPEDPEKEKDKEKRRRERREKRKANSKHSSSTHVTTPNESHSSQQLNSSGEQIQSLSGTKEKPHSKTSLFKSGSSAKDLGKALLKSRRDSESTGAAGESGELSSPKTMNSPSGKKRGGIFTLKRKQSTPSPSPVRTSDDGSDRKGSAPALIPMQSAVSPKQKKGGVSSLWRKGSRKDLHDMALKSPPSSPGGKHLDHLQDSPEDLDSPANGSVSAQKDPQMNASGGSIRFGGDSSLKRGDSASNGSSGALKVAKKHPVLLSCPQINAGQSEDLRNDFLPPCPNLDEDLMMMNGLPPKDSLQHPLPPMEWTSYEFKRDLGQFKLDLPDELLPSPQNEAERILQYGYFESDPIRIGIIGAQYRLLELLATLAVFDSHAVQICAISGVPKSVVDLITERYGESEHVANPSDLVQRDDLEWVFIDSPQGECVSHILLALNAGKHVFCEKPVTFSIDECKEIQKAHQKSGKLFKCGFIWRFIPFYKEIHQILSRGILGDIISVESNHLLEPSEGGFLMCNWTRNKQTANGVNGILLETFSYEIDTLSWLLNSLPSKGIAFSGLDIFTRANRPPNDDLMESYTDWQGTSFESSVVHDPFESDKNTHDNYVIALEFRNLTRATFHINTNCAFPQKRLLICGLRGTLEADLYSGMIRYKTIDTGSEIHRIQLTPGDAHGGSDLHMMEDWLSLAKEQHQAIPRDLETLKCMDGEAIFPCMLVAGGIDRSSSERVPVSFESDWKQLGF